MDLISAALSIAPQASPLGKEAMQYAPAALEKFGLLYRARPVFWLATTLEETGGLTRFRENLNYSAKRLMQVWPKRFRTLEAAQAVAGKPEAIANMVYGGRMGNVNPGDGWKYSGRGMFQLTGRAIYAAVGKVCGLDLEGNPDLALDPKYMAEVSCGYWVHRGLNATADANDFEGFTRLVNGGLINMDKRLEYLARAKDALSRAV